MNQKDLLQLNAYFLGGLFFLGCLGAWYEGSGMRAEVDRGYKITTKSSNNSTAYVPPYVGPITLCSGLDPIDCDAVVNKTKYRPAEVAKEPRQESQRVSWAALHMGALMHTLVFWLLSLCLLCVGVWRASVLVERRWPLSSVATSWENATIAVMRNGFILVWAILLGLIWVLLLVRPTP